ncbi:MAG TPA: hypothetical protein VGZ32_11640 [Actinocrinis sp.]|uniref:hypothetical protein n=1 Tax=Actinocrinis sp. TaxID=1920516 RepID=UPI002DDD0F8C|nr:hypothetical protein [Actinocrinis sp.]HEV3170988.1 hypothetical protein [Actinocrinis sp.]
MSDVGLSAEFERILAERLEERARARFDAFAERTLAWLAFLPEWTDLLADAVGLGDGEDTGELIRRLAQADLIEHRETLSPRGLLCRAFWIHKDLRKSLGRRLRERSAAALDGHLTELALRLAGVDGAGGDGSASWLAAVEALSGSAPTSRILEDIDRGFEEADQARTTRTLAAVEALADVLGGRVTGIAMQARCRIEWFLRRAGDERYLKHYVHRPEVEKALGALIGRRNAYGGGRPDEQSGVWGLHILGPAGCGKTMIIRYLASGRLAAERALGGLAVAQVDFDHLDPRYPEQRLGELFLALAADLRGSAAAPESADAHQHLELAVAALHEELSGDSGRGGGGSARLARLKAEAAERFAAYLGTVAERVVLVLDTCEELAKFYLPGESAPIIDETFELLEAVHGLNPGVRVVLAGRRPLTPPSSPQDKTSGPLLKARKYVEVVQLDGYTSDETQEYIGRRLAAAEAARLDPDLREAILARSRMPTPRGLRYNPFDLAGYCEWAVADEGLDAARLNASTADPYIEHRVIGRITEPGVRAALPAAAELGRFDLDLIEMALMRAGADPRLAFDKLAMQEWVLTVDRDVDGLPTCLEVDEHVRDRMRALLRRTHGWSAQDAERLGLDAEQMVVNAAALGEVPIPTVEAAVLLLPQDHAADLWSRLEQRVCREAAWAWAAQATRRVAAEIERADRAKDEDEPTILAAVLATQAVARIHTNRQDLDGLWKAVAASARRHPDAAAGDRLLLRATLGRIAATGVLDVGEALAATVLKDAAFVDVALEDAPPDALLAAAQSCVGHGTVPPEPLRAALNRLTEHDDLELRVAALAVRSAANILRDGWDRDVRETRSAVELAQRVQPGPRIAWPDWAPPAPPLESARLEVVVTHLTQDQPPDTSTIERFRDWLNDSLTHPDSAAAEPLAASVIRLLRLAVPRAELPRSLPTIWRAAEGAARTVFAPVFPPTIEIAEALSAQGQPFQAWTELRDRIGSQVRTAGVQQVEPYRLALLRLCRSYRTTVFEPSTPRIARDAEASPALRAEAWKVLALTTGEAPATVEEAGSAHAWWAAQSREVLGRRSDWGRSVLERVPDQELTVGGFADWREWTILVREAGGLRNADFTGPSTPTRRPQVLRGDDEDAVRLVFLETPDSVRERLSPVPDAAFGFAALRAGEVLALHLPTHGAGLLRLAEQALGAAGHRLAADQAAVLADLAEMDAGQRQRGSAKASTLRQCLEAQDPLFEPESGRRDWTGWYDLLRLHEQGMPTPAGPAGLPRSVQTRLAGAVSALISILRRRFWWVLLPLSAFGWVATTIALVGAAAATAVGIATSSLIDAYGLAAATLATVVGERIGVQTYRSFRLRRTSPAQSASTRIAIARVKGGMDVAVTLPDVDPGRITRERVLIKPGVRGIDRVLGPVGEDSDLLAGTESTPGGRDGAGAHAITLEIEPGLAAYPWESWLADAVPRGTEGVWVRVSPPRPAAPAADPSTGRSPTVYRGPQYLAPAKSLLDHPAAETAPSLVHLVGTPFETSATWRLLIESEEGDLDVRSVVRNGTFLVLQATPTETRSAFADRRWLPGFVELALAALGAGAAAILVVPPLPEADAAAVSSLLWPRIARGLLDETQIVDLVADIKHRLRDVADPDDGAAARGQDLLFFQRAARRDEEHTTEIQ